MGSSFTRSGGAVPPTAYSDFVNPEWVRLLDVLGMNVRFPHCRGAELTTEDGRVFLDYLSGYCVHNIGHNHPDVIAALKAELDACGPAMLQSSVLDTAGELARQLCVRAGGKLSKVFFASSGSEGVEAVIKFARASTRRTGMVYARGAFHGLTCGALSLMGNSFWRTNFGSMLPSTFEVPFGDLAALDRVLDQQKIAAFIVEPIQGEAGVVLPPEGYLHQAQEICHSHGVLLVLDEVQTGMGRSGRFLAAEHYGVSPDMVVMAKALSGGLVPSAAVLMSDEIYEAVYGSLQRAIIHTSTYSENGLAMRAGLATLAVLDKENLIERAEQSGAYLRQRLREVLHSYEMVQEIRGLGMMNGIVFTAPKGVKLRIAFEACRAIHPAAFGQMVVRRLFLEHQILSQICGNNFMALKVTPPLNVSPAQMDRYVAAIHSVVDALHSSSTFWSDALAIGSRAMGI
jgi:ornithine--oxo-acid transaminase